MRLDLIVLDFYSISFFPELLIFFFFFFMWVLKETISNMSQLKQVMSNKISFAACISLI